MVPPCTHYQRKVMFLAPCCQKQYACRRCHDQNEKHQLNRRDVTTVICTSCNFRQEVRQTCIRCRELFGSYFCAKCRMYDFAEKGQFHCNKCDICRVGGRTNFFHCDMCNMCLNINIRQSHKCVQNSGRDGCTVCLEDIHSYTGSVVVPVCGHLIHETCFDSLKKVNINSCPTCRAELKRIM